MSALEYAASGEIDFGQRQAKAWAGSVRKRTTNQLVLMRKLYLIIMIAPPEIFATSYDQKRLQLAMDARIVRCLYIIYSRG
jgi:hypothetical protein